MTSLSEKHEALGFQKGIHLGINQGRQEGRQEGEATLFIRLLQHRFKRVPESYLHRITQAGPETLLEWSDRLLTATTLEAVFNFNEDVCQM